MNWDRRVFRIKLLRYREPGVTHIFIITWILELHLTDGMVALSLFEYVWVYVPMYILDSFWHQRQHLISRVYSMDYK